MYTTTMQPPIHISSCYIVKGYARQIQNPREADLQPSVLCILIYKRFTPLHIFQQLLVAIFCGKS